MCRPRTIQPHPDLFAGEERPSTPKVPERPKLLALVSQLLTETVTMASIVVREDDHEDHV